MAKQTKTPGAAPAQKQAAIDWGQYQQTGLEKVTTEDLGIPFLSIIQSGSPEFKKSHKDYKTKGIEGAQEGCIFNTVTRDILHYPGSDPLIFVPCAFEKAYNEWKLREDGGGGGFIRAHSNPAVLNECHRNERNQDILPNGNQIVTTSVIFGKYEHEGRWEPAIISFVSTQLKKARGWLNMAMAIKQGGRPLPLFSHKYAITTIPESNQSGSWMGWHIEGAGQVTDIELINDCSNVAKKIVSGSRPLLGAPSAGTDDVPM